MKAIIWTKYGAPDGLILKEVEKPVPKADEILVKIHASTVTAGDCEMRSMQMPIKIFNLFMRLYFGLKKPKKEIILGQEFSGEIVALGNDIRSFNLGDKIIGHTGFNFGGYAEFVCLAETSIIIPKPSNMGYEEAATVPIGAMVAYHFISQANLKEGQKVLINGAGGSIGTMAVQLAKTLGAVVTAVDSGEKLSMLENLGADAVIDYHQENFTENGEKYHVIFDIVGKSSYSKCLKSLVKHGVYLLGNPKISQMFRGPWTKRFKGIKVILSQPSEKAEISGLLKMKTLIEAGRIKTVIDRRYPLDKTPEAHKYVDTGKKKGNVVIIIEHSD